MKIIITLILSAFLLTSCSNPDTSGGVTLHKRPGDPDAVCESDGGNKKCIPGYTDDFPHGLCTGPTELGAKSETTGCGYIWAYGSQYYIRPGVNLSGAKLTKKNLYGANLKRANLTNANLSNANLSGANLYGANMHRANLKEANLQNSDLRWAKLNDTSLESTNLSNTKMYRASVERANLTGADLRNAKLIYTDFRGRVHQETKLYEADFSHADTYGAITNDYIYCPDRWRYRRRNQQTGTWANCPF